MKTKRILSLILILTLLLSAIPLQALAGNIETGSGITSLVFDDDTATVCWNIELNSADVHVAVYDENGKLVGFASQNVTGKTGTAELTLGIDMPEYFDAKAYLTEPETWKPLGDSAGYDWIQSFFESNAELQSMESVTESDHMLTEAEVKTLLEERGFTTSAITWEYSASGEFTDETEVSEESKQKHPMYRTLYSSAAGVTWVIYVIGDDVIANPVDYNLYVNSDVGFLVAESETLTSYSEDTNLFYYTDPDDSAVKTQVVECVNAETLDTITVESVCNLTGESVIEYADDADEEEDLEDTVPAAPSESLIEESEFEEAEAASDILSSEVEDPIIVVSLGDSYSSGEGNEPFYGQEKELSDKITDYDWLAHRSKKSWAARLEFSGVSGVSGDYRYQDIDADSSPCVWYFAAAAGATTKNFKNVQEKTAHKSLSIISAIEATESLPVQLDVFDGLYIEATESLPAQLDVFDGLYGEVDYVTMTIGGNDVDFLGVITAAVTDFKYLHIVCEKKTGAKSLENKLKTLWDKIDTYMSRIEQAYKDVEDAAGTQAAIIVAGYPKLLSPGAGNGWSISKDEAKLVNEKISDFNEKIEALVNECRAEGMNIYFADVEAEFDEDGIDHGMFAKNAWINPIWLQPKDEDLNDFTTISSYSVHPNEQGQKAYARCVNAVIKSIEVIKSVEEENGSASGYTGTAEVGSYITFGHYEQDNNTANGTEPIEWLVLDVDEDNHKALVISKYALDCQPYNTVSTAVTWETCTLRSWLNDTFLSAAFAPEEQASILQSTISNLNNSSYYTAGGNATTDRIFLLSIEEANQYFSTDLARRCAATAYAIAQGACSTSSYQTEGGEATCWRWLRSPGRGSYYAAIVDYYGSVSDYGYFVYDYYAVRPAFWINLAS